MSLSKIEVHLDDDNEFLIEEMCASRGMCVFFFFFDRSIGEMKEIC